MTHEYESEEDDSCFYKGYNPRLAREVGELSNEMFELKKTIKDLTQSVKILRQTLEERR